MDIPATFILPKGTVINLESETGKPVVYVTGAETKVTIEMPPQEFEMPNPEDIPEADTQQDKSFWLGGEAYVPHTLGVEGGYTYSYNFTTTENGSEESSWSSTSTFGESFSVVFDDE